MNRVAFINFLRNYAVDKSSLEIGALDRPLLHPSSFPKNKILDVFSKEDLIKNYWDDPNVIKENIVNVDYVVKGQDYNSVIPANNFDIVVSSHNIEHQPCLVTYLQNIDSVLKPGGRLFLIVPDYRYCFDAYRDESNILEVLGASLSKHKAPSGHTLLECELKKTHNYSQLHWNKQHGAHRDINDANVLLESYNSLKNRLAVTDYIDAHVWKFTPKSLCNIMRLLFEMKLTTLKVDQCLETEQNHLEFFVILSKVV